MKKRGYAQSGDDARARALPDELRAAGAEAVYVDHRHSGREERDRFIKDLRSKDTAILLSRSDLGKGKEIGRLEALINSKCKGIEIPEAKAPARRKPGPAPKWQPDYEEERYARHCWHGPYQRQDALRMIEDRLGYRVSVGQLNSHIGPRSKPKPWINVKPTQERS